MPPSSSPLPLPLPFHSFLPLGPPLPPLSRSSLQHAVDLGFDHLTLDARVDDGLALGGWRNTLSFDPLEVYGNYSYLEAILFPLAHAAAGVLGRGAKVDFVMQGGLLLAFWGAHKATFSQSTGCCSVVWGRCPVGCAE